MKLSLWGLASHCKIEFLRKCRCKDERLDDFITAAERQDRKQLPSSATLQSCCVCRASPPLITSAVVLIQPLALVPGWRNTTSCIHLVCLNIWMSEFFFFFLTEEKKSLSMPSPWKTESCVSVASYRVAALGLTGSFVENKLCEDVRVTIESSNMCLLLLFFFFFFFKSWRPRVPELDVE